MIRWLINYLRQCFCIHEWELLGENIIYDSQDAQKPIATRYTYRCKKCGYSQRIRL